MSCILSEYPRCFREGYGKQEIKKIFKSYYSLKKLRNFRPKMIKQFWEYFGKNSSKLKKNCYLQKFLNRNLLYDSFTIREKYYIKVAQTFNIKVILYILKNYF